jgi:DNA-binding LacI/PurR family transcriptional regulator
MEQRIAVVSTNFGTGFPGQIWTLFKKLAQPHQALTECFVPERTAADLAHARWLKLIEERPAVIIGICVRPEPAVMAAYHAAGIPVVLVDEEVEGASTVASDNVAGGHLAGQHLARAGRRSMAVVCGDMKMNGGYNAVQRVKGFARALAEHRLPFAVEEALEVVDYTKKDGVTSMLRILQEGRKIDALFSAAGDATATGVLQVARERGIAVPGQLAVVGYDDSPLASISSPPLTTVRQSVPDIAAAAFKLATAETAEILAKPRRVLLAPSLVVRESA